MSDELNETKLCNMALGRIGTKRINDYTDNSDKKVEAIQCRLNYAQTRDALLRSHWWRFARTRKQLSQSAEYTADATTFEWTYAYGLPTDFLRMWIRPWEDNDEVMQNTRYSYSVEGKQLLSDVSSMYIRYIRKVTDVPTFDPLFIEVLILQLALKMVMPLTGAGREAMAMRASLYVELYGTPRQPGVMSRVRLMDKSETKTIGSNDMPTWNEARMAGVGNPLKRYS